MNNTVITKQGSRIDVIITTKLILFENENAVLGILQDISGSQRKPKNHYSNFD